MTEHDTTKLSYLPFEQLIKRNENSKLLIIVILNAKSRQYMRVILTGPLKTSCDFTERSAELQFHEVYRHSI